MDLERTIAALQWRMGLPCKEGKHEEDWETLENWLRADSSRLEAVTLKMARPLIEILQWGLSAESTKESLASSWSDLKGFLQSRRELPNWMVRNAAAYIQDNLQGERQDSALAEPDPPVVKAGVSAVPEGSEVTNPETTLPAVEATMKQVPPTTVDNQEESGATTAPVDANAEPDLTTSTLTDAPESTEEVVTVAPDSSSPSQSGQWRWLPVPPDSPDNHEESYQTAMSSPGGMKLIGARVRGKKHKHEGTNCDDWFEFDVIGKWTIIAVSDGAGSKIFSRIGAKESCRTALSELKNSLGEHELKKRDNWSGDTFKRDKTTGVFNADDLEHVQQALHNAMAKAYEAVEAKAQALAKSAPHKEFLGREVVVDDLSGTLLLAVHTIVEHEGAERSVVFTCQIGDGMLAAVSSNAGLQLLGIPDSGEFAGQTEFLTSKKKVEKTSLVGRTFPFFGPLEVLMVMTDGVADDYFPNDPGMLWLYGDLAINGVLNLSGSQRPLSGSELTKALEDIRVKLAETKLPTIDAVEAAGLAVPFAMITEAEVSPNVSIRSIATYADKLGLAPEEVVKSKPLLIVGAFGEPMCERTIADPQNKEEMLRVWLDSYQVRGSFDDRTLVVLHREVAS